MNNQNNHLEQYFQGNDGETPLQNQDDYQTNPQKIGYTQNHDLPLSSVAQTLQNFLLTNNSNMNDSQQSIANQANQNTANFNSVAQFNQFHNEPDDRNRTGNSRSLSQQQMMFLAQQQQQEQVYFNQNSSDDNIMIQNDFIDQNRVENTRGRQTSSRQNQLPPRSHSQTYGGSFGSANLLKAQHQLNLQQQQQINTNNLYSNNNKQVRFSIKDGIKNLIEDSYLEIESIASRSHSMSKVNQGGSKQGMRDSRQNNSTIQKDKIKSKSPKQQSASLQRKSASFKTRQLALKYKREADESRKKKQGDLKDDNFIEDISSIPDQLSHLNNNSYTERVNIERTPEKIVQQLPTPSQRPKLQEDIQLPKQIPQRQNQQQLSNTLTSKQQQMPINPVIKNPTKIEATMIGTIVRRENISQTRDLQLNQSICIAKQAGTILRKRSVSPGEAMQLTQNKENSSQIMNLNNSSMTGLAGQIVKKQKMNMTQTYIHQEEQVMSPKIIQSERQPPRQIIQSQLKQQYSERKEQAPQYSFRQDSKVNLVKEKPKAIVIFYKCIWDCFNQTQSEVEKRFDVGQKSLNQLRFQLLTNLTQQPRYPSLNNNFLEPLNRQKLASLRQSLPQLFQEKFKVEILQIINLRDQRSQKIFQLKQTFKQIHFSNQQLKIQLLKDIIARLTQKIVLKVLLLNHRIKVEISAQFLAYYQEYIARDYLLCGLHIFKRYSQKMQEKNQYLYIAKSQIQKVRQQQVFKAWKNIKEYKKQNLLRKQETKSLLLSRKIVRLITHWKIVIIQQRNLQLGNALSNERQKLKLLQELFIKWVYQHRTSNKIKRKALLMVSPSAKKRFVQNNDILNDDEWLSQQMQSLKSQFNSRIQEYLLEREHNHTFINGLRFKITGNELSQAFPLRSNQNMNGVKIKDLTGAKKNNEMKIYQQYPELRFKSKSPIRQHKNLVNLTFTNINSANLDYHPEPSQIVNVRKSQELNIGLKYSIHSALVNQQNTAKLIDQSQAQEILAYNQSTHKNHRSDSKLKTNKKLLPPPPKRLIELQQKQQDQINQSSIVPNQFFKKLQDQVQTQNQSFTHRQHNQEMNHQDNLMTIPLDIQLREHIKSLQFKIRAFETLSQNHHFKASLKLNASNVLQSDQEEFNGIQDYIQYGISCDQYRMVFIRMFQTKAVSVLFNQWKIKYLKKQLYQDLESLHIIKYSHQSFIEWIRVIKARKLKIKEFNRTSQVHKFYQIFIKWSQWNKQNSLREKRLIKEFQLKLIFKNWVNYLDNQGQNLMKILRSQQYYKQALMSKSLLSLYQNYLKQLRVKRFSRKVMFKKFFSKKWKIIFLKRVLLQKILNKVNDRLLLNERLKYQREFEIKREVIGKWKVSVQEKVQLIQHYTALTHYKQTIICKSFIAFKKNQRLNIGSRLLVSLILNNNIRPVFDQLRDATQSQKNTEFNFMTYRQNYLKAQVYNVLRQNTVENRLQKLFMKKKVFKVWQKINFVKNHQLPLQYREQKLQQIFLQFMKRILKHKWAQERSVIIEKNLLRQKDQKLKKIIFVKLLENILQEKRSRIVNQTVREFRDHNLQSKCFKILKKIWSYQNTDRIMNKVARDFNQKILKRRQLKKRQYYESKGIQFIDDDQMTKNRVFNAWKLHIEHKLTKNLVLKRFLEFKSRFQTLRTFLAWRSMAKYEHTPSRHQTSRQSTQGAGQLQINAQNSNFKPLDTTHRSSTPSNSNYPNLPFSIQSPQFNDRNSSKNHQIRTSRDSLPQKDQYIPQQIHREHSFNQLNYNSNMNYNSQGYVSNTNDYQNQQNIQQPMYRPNYPSIIGDQDLTQIRPQLDETPFKQNDQAQDKSLFDELENIFQKNKKWLDEQKEREDFLREMAQHYNQRLSQEMNSLKYTTLTQSDKYRSITSVNK